MKKFALVAAASGFLLPALALAQSIDTSMPALTPAQQAQLEQQNLQQMHAQTSAQIQQNVQNSDVFQRSQTYSSSNAGFPTPNPGPLQLYANATQAFINGALVPVLLAIAFIVFLWGVANAYLLHPGDEEKRKQGHQFILWGVIGFVVIFSVWGLVNLVGSVLGLGAGGVGPPPPGINLSQ